MPDIDCPIFADRRQAERAKNAAHRFYVLSVGSNGYSFHVCDAERDPKTLAKFRYPDDAVLFAKSVLERYVANGDHFPR